MTKLVITVHEYGFGANKTKLKNKKNQYKPLKPFEKPLNTMKNPIKNH